MNTVKERSLTKDEVDISFHRIFAERSDVPSQKEYDTAKGFAFAYATKSLFPHARFYASSCTYLDPLAQRHAAIFKLKWQEDGELVANL